MKALVLAGGEGTRLRPLTYSGPKQLVPVANRPILYYVIDRVVEAGITEVGVVVAPETAPAIRAALGDGAELGARVTYVEQAAPRGLAHAVQVAEGFLGGSAFLMVLGDNLIGASLALFVDGFEASADEARLLLKDVEDPRRFGVAEIGPDGRVVRLVEKPALPPSNLALVGVYLFRASIHGAVRRISPSARGELEITDAANELMRGGAQVRFDRLEGFWLDTGKKDDVLDANETVLSAWLSPARLGAVDAESTLSGEVRVEAGARVTRSVLRGPLVVGAGAVIEDAEVGPGVAIGAGAVVARTSIERSIVLAGARLSDAGRLSRCLVGRRAVVSRSATAATSLVIGDDCAVELALPALGDRG